MSEALDAIKKAYKGRDVTVSEEDGNIFIYCNKHEFFSVLPASFLVDDPGAPERLLRKWKARLWENPEHEFPLRKKDT